MNKILLIVIFFISLTECQAQSKMSSDKAEQQTLVTVLDWKERSIIQTGNFFDETEMEIINQIGLTEFQKVKKYGNMHGWPSQLKTNLFDRRDTAAQKRTAENFKKLVVYKIAYFIHKLEGKQWGPYVILKALYSENTFLDNPGHSDAIYFIIREQFVTEKK